MRIRWLCVALILLAYQSVGSQETQPPPAKLKPFDPFGTTEPSPDNLEQQRSIVQRLSAAADDSQAALAAMDELPQPPTELELRVLRNLDRELSGSDDAAHRQLVNQGVQALALSGEATSLQYLHKVFDSHPSRRAAIAASLAELALAGKRRPHEWPLLVRSLTTVKEKQAQRVVAALAKYRDRGTSPVVQRNVLLVALALGDERAQPALALLAYWSGARAAATTLPIDEQLVGWQAWYQEKYPALPAAKLPVDDPASPHKGQELLAFLQSSEALGDEQRGAVLFEKGLCIKCHQFGERGERIGPNLTSVSKRLSDEELLQSLLYPSHQILDQYATKQIETHEGRVFVGIVGESAAGLMVLTAEAKKITIAKEDIAAIVDSPLSAMPTGSIDKLSREEIADLFQYLKSE